MHQSSVCVEVAAAHQLFQNRETSEEAPFNPRGLVLMPTLALVKGKATQCMESIGIQGRSVGFPHRNRQWEKKKCEASASELRSIRHLHCSLHHSPFHCLDSTVGASLS